MKKEISETIKSKVHFNHGTGLYELSKYQIDDLTDELEKLFAIPVVIESVCEHKIEDLHIDELSGLTFCKCGKCMH